MRFEINFDQSPAHVYIQTNGEASASGFDDLLTAIVTSPNWRTGTKLLVDHMRRVKSAVDSWPHNTTILGIFQVFLLDVKIGKFGVKSGKPYNKYVRVRT